MTQNEKELLKRKLIEAAAVGITGAYTSGVYNETVKGTRVSFHKPDKFIHVITTNTEGGIPVTFEISVRERY